MTTSTRPPGRPSDGVNLRSAILDAARELAALLGVENVRLIDVARVAGVSTTAIQYHFGGRSRLLAEAMGEEA